MCKKRGMKEILLRLRLRLIMRLNNPVCLALGDGLPTGRLNDSTTQRINAR
jgi:hypothetical protein